MTHIMNLDDMRLAAEKRTVVWLEKKDNEKIIPLCFNGSEFMGLSEVDYLLLSECDEEHCPAYKALYRVWSLLPTKSQQLKEKWRDLSED